MKLNKGRDKENILKEGSLAKKHHSTFYLTISSQALIHLRILTCFTNGSYWWFETRFKIKNKGMLYSSNVEMTFERDGD